MKIIQVDENNQGHYSSAVISNNMLYVSGQLGIDPVTKALPYGGIKDQTEMALKNLDDILQKVGSDRTSVVQCRIYISDIKHWEDVNKIYSSFFGAHKPARIVVPVGELHYGSLVEVEAIAEMVPI